MLILAKRKELSWTNHSKRKMRFYGLSEARVKRVMHSPRRIETGIAPKTIAMMQSAGTKENPFELWVMLQDSKTKRIVISAWRYPGITKPGSILTKSILHDEYAGSMP